MHESRGVSPPVIKLTNEESCALARPRADEDGAAGASAIGHCKICARALAVPGGEILETTRGNASARGISLADYSMPDHLRPAFTVAL